MKHVMKAIALSGALAALVPLAHAASISATLNLSGSDSFDVPAKTLNFINGLTDLATGSINGTTYGASNPVAVTFTAATLSYGSSPTNVNPALQIYTVAGVSFYVTSETPLTSQYTVSGQTYNVLDLRGTGYFLENGYTQTMGTYDLTTQELAGASTGTLTSFSATSGTVAPTPEPSSLILLGTGVLGAAGMLRHRFAGKSNP